MALTTATATADPRELVFLLSTTARIAELLREMERTEGARSARRRALSTLTDELQAISDQIRMDVADAVADNGKPRYTNVESRAVAAAQLLRADPQAQTLQKRIAELEAECDDLQMAFEAARRERSSLHTLLEFSAAWLGWYTAGKREQERN